MLDLLGQLLELLYELPCRCRHCHLGEAGDLLHLVLLHPAAVAI